jgi:hypothetical protein
MRAVDGLAHMYVRMNPIVCIAHGEIAQPYERWVIRVSIVRIRAYT